MPRNEVSEGKFQPEVDYPTAGKLLDPADLERTITIILRDSHLATSAREVLGAMVDENGTFLVLTKKEVGARAMAQNPEYKESYLRTVLLANTRAALKHDTEVPLEIITEKRARGERGQVVSVYYLQYKK